MKNKNKGILWLCVIGFVLICMIFPGCVRFNQDEQTPETKNDTVITFLDVGQGDSACIQTGGGKTMLVDAGDGGNKKNLLSDLKTLGVTQIDILLLTHMHSDHIGGAYYIMKNLPVKQVMISLQTRDNEMIRNINKIIAEKKIPTETVSPGDRFTLDDCSFQVFGPKKDNYKDLNNSSIVFKMTHGKDRFLFTGDAEHLEEDEILADYWDISCDVLKVGHHGSHSSTSPEWLNACGGRLKSAVISAGVDNSYGLPHEEILSYGDRFTIYRTDQQGNITAVSSGDGIRFRTEK